MTQNKLKYEIKNLLYSSFLSVDFVISKWICHLYILKNIEIDCCSILKKHIELFVRNTKDVLDIIRLNEFAFCISPGRKTILLNIWPPFANIGTELSNNVVLPGRCLIRYLLFVSSMMP